MGRRKKPIELQLSEGDTRKKGTLKVKQEIASHVKSARGLPHAPKSLDWRERVEYKGIKEALEELSRDDSADYKLVALASIACAAARTRRSGETLRTAVMCLDKLGLAGRASRLGTDAKHEDTGKDLMEMLSTPREPRKERVQ